MDIISLLYMYVTVLKEKVSNKKVKMLPFNAYATY